MGRGWKRARKLSTAPVPYPTTGLQTVEDAGRIGRAAQAHRRERAGMAIWQTAGGPVRAKVGTAWARYFPLGLPVARCVAMAARGGLLALYYMPYNKPSHQRCPSKAC